MRTAILLAAALWPGVALAEAAFLPPLLDSIGNPESRAEDLVKALRSAGFRVEMVSMVGPEALSGAEADPYYFYLSADLSPGSELAPDGLPLMDLTCSRIGLPTRQAIAAGALVTALQTWASVVDFEPGALAQLKCQVNLLPLKGAVLPTTQEVLAAITPRYGETASETGTAERSTVGLGWVLYPPLEASANVGQALLVGQTLITGRNPAMSGAGKPDWIVYDHFEKDYLHSIGLAAHIPLTGS